MSTALKHLDDLKWLFMEKGLQHVYDWMRGFFTATIVTPASTVGGLEVDGTTNFAAAIEATVKPSGQLDLVHSTTLEFGSGAVSRTPPTNVR